MPGTAPEDHGHTDSKVAERAAKTLRMGVEIPMSVAAGVLLAAAFNAGMTWRSFNQLVDEVKEFKDITRKAQESSSRAVQENNYQDRQLADHESRLRTVERK